MKVLVIAAHLDDEVLGVGGTLARHASKGHEIVVLNLCDRSENHKRDEYMIRLLREQSESVRKVLGISRYVYAGLQDEYLDELLIRVIEPIETVMAEFKPDVVYTHHQNDVNQDHRAAFLSTLVATRSFSRPHLHSIYSYEVLSNSEQAPAGMQFQPDHFVWIEPWLPIKLRAMAQYSQEMRPYPFPRSEEGIVALADYRGMMCVQKASEAFKTIRTIAT